MNYHKLNKHIGICNIILMVWILLGVIIIASSNWYNATFLISYEIRLYLEDAFGALALINIMLILPSGYFLSRGD